LYPIRDRERRSIRERREGGEGAGCLASPVDRGGTSTLKCVFCKINEKLVCANVPSILPL